MPTSCAGIEFIKNYEKLRLKAYKPTPKDKWTIGYGTTVIDGKPIQPGLEITKEQAELYLCEHLKELEKIIEENVKAPITPNQYDALISLVYNIGETQFKQSTLLRYLNRGHYGLAGKEFHRWIYQKGKPLSGLIARRQAEKEIFERA